MKYKVIGIIACVVVLIASVINWNYLFGITESKRFHQHLEAEPKKECEKDHSDGTLCSHLPLICIDTGGKEIPGKGIYSDDGPPNLFTVAEDGSDRISAKISVVDHTEEMNHPCDEPEISSDMTIHVRGNSSRFFDKPGYRIKLTDSLGNNNPQPLLGMDSHHEWALHGPYLDKTLIRNYMMYNLAGEISDYAPNVRFCEVILNGEYEGVYVLTETIDSGKDGARLSMSVSAKRSTYTGYLLRLDRRQKSEIENFSTLTDYTYRANHELKLDIIYPGAKNINEALKDSIERDFSLFEKALYSYDFNNKKYGYRNFIDVDSFISYFLINEFSANYDAGSYSTYIYKDISGKYKMCVWDFNNACDNYQEQSLMNVQHFELQSKLWFEMLTKDKDFVEGIIGKYKQLRGTLFSDKALEEYIDGTIEYLGPAIDRNSRRWASSFEDDTLLNPAERNLHSYEEAVEQLKSFFFARTEWLDDNIESLRQYCADSKIKKYTEATD